MWPKFRNLLALLFLIIYAIIQWQAIHNSSGQDDVISARVQDIMVVIIAYYFVASSRDTRK
jgi:hypothetical protein